MARQHITVRVEDPSTGRLYEATGSYSDVSATDSEEKAVKRAVRRIADQFGPGTYNVKSTQPTWSESAPRMLPTAEEQAMTKRNTLVWMIRKGLGGSPMDVITEYAAKYEGTRGFANVADALAWRVEDAMKADVKKAWSEAVHDRLEAAGVFVEGYREADQRTFQNSVADGPKFDEVIEQVKADALKKALENSSHSTSPVHNLKADIERAVAADLYKTLAGEGGWW